jgi:hypothetical protein
VNIFLESRSRYAEAVALKSFNNPKEPLKHTVQKEDAGEIYRLSKARQHSFDTIFFATENVDPDLVFDISDRNDRGRDHPTDRKNAASQGLPFSNARQVQRPPNA